MDPPDGAAGSRAKPTGPSRVAQRAKCHHRPSSRAGRARDKSHDLRDLPGPSHPSAILEQWHLAAATLEFRNSPAAFALGLRLNRINRRQVAAGEITCRQIKSGRVCVALGQVEVRPERLQASFAQPAGGINRARLWPAVVMKLRNSCGSESSAIRAPCRPPRPVAGNQKPPRPPAWDHQSAHWKGSARLGPARPPLGRVLLLLLCELDSDKGSETFLLLNLFKFSQEANNKELPSTVPFDFDGSLREALDRPRGRTSRNALGRRHTCCKLSSEPASDTKLRCKSIIGRFWSPV